MLTKEGDAHAGGTIVQYQEEIPAAFFGDPYLGMFDCADDCHLEVFVRG